MSKVIVGLLIAFFGLLVFGMMVGAVLTVLLAVVGIAIRIASLLASTLLVAVSWTFQSARKYQASMLTESRNRARRNSEATLSMNSKI